MNAKKIFKNPKIAVIPETLQGPFAAIRKMIDIADAKSPEFRQALRDRYLSDVAGTTLTAELRLGGPIVATAEALFNRSLHKGGDPIERQGDKYLSKQYRAAPGTQNVYRFAAEHLGGITSPDILKHVARGFGATLSDKAADALDPLFANHVSSPNSESSNRNRPIESNEPSILKKSPLVRAGLELGYLREGQYDTNKETSDNSVARVQQDEKDLMAQVKQYHLIAIRSRNPSERDAAIQKRNEIIQQVVKEVGPYGGVPDFKNILAGLSKEVAFEQASPENRAMQHMPKRYRAYYRSILDRER